MICVNFLILNELVRNKLKFGISVYEMSFLYQFGAFGGIFKDFCFQRPKIFLRKIRMTELDFDSLVQLVEKHFSQTSGTNEERVQEWKQLDRLASRIDFLPFAYQIAKSKLNSLHAEYFSFLAMTTIIERRGCLLDAQQLLEHLLFLLQFIQENVNFFSTQISILNQAASATSITMRQLIEKNTPIDSFMDKIMSILESSNDGRYVVLNIIDTFIEIMNNTYHYIDLFTQQKIKTMFCSSILPILITTALNSLSQDSKNSIAALKVVSDGLKAASQANSEQFQFLSYPASFTAIYHDDSFLTAIFNQLQSPNKEVKRELFKVLDFYLRASTSMWATKDEMYQFLLFSADQFKQVIMDLQIDEEYIQYVCCSIAHICHQIQSEHFPVDRTWIEFINTIGQFSTKIFQTKFSHISNTIVIWNFVTEMQLTADIQSDVSVFVFDVLKSIVLSALEQIQNSDDFADLAENASLSYDSGDLRHIWESTKFCHPEFTQFIGEIFDQKISEASSPNCTAATLIQLQFLILLASARFHGIKVFQGNVSNINFAESEEFLSEKISLFIQSSQEHIGAYAVQIGEPAIELERSIVTFGREFLLCHFSSSDNYGTNPYVPMMTVLLNRLTYDLVLFNDSDGTFKLLDDILNLIEKCVSRKQSNALLRNIELIQNLYNRNISIEFEGLQNPEEHCEVRKKLYEMYAKLITSRSNFLEFLNAFEQRFKEIESNPTPLSVIDLYSDLSGVVIGLSVETFIRKFVQWISENYVDTTVALINACSGDATLVSIIVSLWTNIIKKADFFKFTGTGIMLFRAATQICGAVAENVVGDAPEAVRAEQMEMLIQLINAALTSNIANFGLMKHYGDTSADELIALFFNGVLSLQYNGIKDGNKVAMVLETLSAITQDSANELLPYEDRMEAVLSFTAACFDDINKETWQKNWDVVRPLFFAVAESGNSKLLSLFRAHFTYVLSAIITVNDLFTFSSVELIILMNEADPAFTSSAFQSLVSMYDPKFQGTVIEEINNLLNKEKGSVNERAPVFHNAMKQYPTSLVDNPFFAEYY